MVDFIYDVSRLSTRTLNTTPNGIDWIDSLLADDFLSSSGGGASALLFGFRRPRLFPPGRLANPVRALDQAWGRAAQECAGAIPEWLISALTGDRHAAGAKTSEPGAIRREARRVGRIARSLRTYGFNRGYDPTTDAPSGAVYLNASHFPLEQARHVRWLEQRPDIRPVVFVHDLLPVLRPDLFWSSEPERHGRRLAFLARRGAAAIVASSAVESQLDDQMRKSGRRDLSILRAPPPVLPLFRQPCPLDPRLARANFFVMCGTIEPRKNHLLLIDVWRRLAAARGADAPRLLLVGKRGWRCDDIVASIRDPALQGLVIEASGLSTAAYRSVLAHSRALLSPSLAEGFGLPVAEALAARIPVIASAIAPHFEQGGQTPIYLDPRRPEDWRLAVDEFARPGSPARAGALARLDGHTPVDPVAYLGSLRASLSALG